MEKRLSNINKKAAGEVIAIITLFAWSTSFISTRELLKSFEPVEINFFRYLLAYGLFWTVCRKKIPFRGLKKELPIMAMGLFGVTFYYYFQNVALDHTTMANAGVLTTLSGLFIVVLNRIFFKEKAFTPWFTAGLIAAIVGASIISLDGAKLEFNPLGDLFAIGAALCWAVYSMFIRVTAKENYDGLAIIRRTFFWGMIFMLPLLAASGCEQNWARFANTTNILCFLHLAVICSILCYYTWNISIKLAGMKTTSAYITASPIFSIAISLISGESMSFVCAVGVCLVLAGLVLTKLDKKTEEIPPVIDTE